MADNDRNSTLDHMVAEAIAGIRCGPVEITIHDARIVQIEQREKLRPGAGANNRPGARRTEHRS